MQLAVVVGGEVAESPYDDAGSEDDGGHFLQVFLAFLPSVAEHCFGGGHAVGRQLHDKGQALAFDKEAAEQFGHQHGHYHAQ